MMHWLGVVAETAGVDGTELLGVAPEAAVDLAWDDVKAACQLDDRELVRLVAESYRLPIADLPGAEPGARGLVPAEMARKHRVFPVRQAYGELTVATADPTNVLVEQELSFASGRRVVFAVATPRAVQEAIEAHYSPDRAVEALLYGAEIESTEGVQLVEEHGPESIAASEAEAGPVVKLANLILQTAIRDGASDVHVQPGPGGAIVRFRVDGVLRRYMQMPLPVLARLIARIKIMGKIDVADRLRPHDGRARIHVASRMYDLRISTVPTREHEKAVIRILDPESAMGLEALGMLPEELARLRRLLNHREGIVVVTGPTGSGKTTTLYGALRDLATEDVNIMTVEDPVEYELPGLTQIQVEPKRNVTFASALRAILRQDPDIILVGEIRDLETARVAVQASMTGHLVLATLHTNDAVGSIRRLTDLGLDAASVVSTLRGAVSQRLIRAICSDCAEAVGDGGDEDHLREVYGVQGVMRAPGCATCGNSGYRGRLPLLEVMAMDDDLGELILKDASPSHLHRAATAGGMRGIREAGLEMVRRGHTTLTELDRVLGEGEEEGKRANPPRGSDTDNTPESVTNGTGRALIIDDDDGTRIVARALLEKHGFDVREAPDGEEGLAAVDTNGHLDLVVLDLDMPKVTGWDVLKRLRGSIATAALPIVVMTGTADLDSEVKVLEQGADDYIRKPLDPARFISRVKATLRRAGSPMTDR